MLIFVTLGFSTKNSEEKDSMLSKFRVNNSSLNLFCLTTNENIVFTSIMERGVKLRKYLNGNKDVDISTREDNINNLKKDLENVVKIFRTLGKASLLRFLQHFVSYLIFGIALMIDYKGNSSKKYIF